MPVECCGLGSDATVPINSGACKTSMGSSIPQAKMQTSGLSSADAMATISQSGCPVGQAFVVANISPSTIKIKLARRSLMGTAIKRDRECIMMSAQSGAMPANANHMFGNRIMTL